MRLDKQTELENCEKDSEEADGQFCNWDIVEDTLLTIFKVFFLRFDLVEVARNKYPGKIRRSIAAQRDVGSSLAPFH